MFDAQLKALEEVGFDISDCILDKKDKTIGWLCTYVPEEIIHASGFHPVRIEGSGNPVRKADALLHNNMCPFVRSVLDDAIEGKMSNLSGIVISNSCDAMKRLFDAWSVFLENDTLYYLSPPKRINDSNISFYAGELRDFADALNLNCPGKITVGSLKKSIKIFNETRFLMAKVSRLAGSDSLSGYTAFNIMHMAVRCNREQFNIKLKEFLDRFTPEKNNEKGIRVLLTGCMIDRADQIKLIQDSGAKITVNELCTGSRQFDLMVSEHGDPFEALAERYIKKASCSRMMNINERIDYLIRLAKENRIDGVIYYIIKFCDNYIWDLPKIKDAFNNTGIPVLDVEGDYIKGSFGPLKTRIQAFVESIEN